MQVIKPGILVSLKSTVAGGVQYARTNIDTGTTLESGAHREKWQTEKVVIDLAAHEAASKTRSKALALIRAVCNPTAFGLLCVEGREAELDAKVREARAMVEENNATNPTTRVTIYCLKGRVASTDEEAARAIASEVSDLVAAMNAGVGALDVEKIRDAADRAKGMLAMLSDEKAEAVSEAIKQARSAARTIVKRVQKDGEKAEIVARDIQTGALEKARIAFLDLSDDTIPAPADAMPVTDVQRIASLDVGEEEEVIPESADPNLARNADGSLDEGDIETRAASAG